MRFCFLFFIKFSLMFSICIAKASPVRTAQSANVDKKLHHIKELTNQVTNLLLYEEKILIPYLEGEDLYALQNLSLKIKNIVVPPLQRMQLSREFREKIFLKMIHSATRSVKKEMSLSSSDLFLATYIFLNGLNRRSVKGKVNQIRMLQVSALSAGVSHDQETSGIQSFDAYLEHLRGRIPREARLSILEVNKHYQMSSPFLVDLRCSSLSGMSSPLHLRHVFSMWRDVLLLVKKQSWRKFGIFDDNLRLFESDLQHFPCLKAFYDLQFIS